MVGILIAPTDGDHMRLLAETANSDAGGTFFLFGFALLGYLLYCFPLALIFKKAGQTPWTAFIPIVNIYVLCKTVGRPGWWVILFLIPIVGFIVSIIVFYDLAKSFGHGGGFTVGLVLLPWIFMFILALNKDTYRGPAAA
jgi:uncharacterized membrane protein YhaH (DUF805 family)